MIRFILSLFIPFRWFIERMGANHNQFISLLKLKLTIDDRNTKRLSGKTGNKKSNVLLWQSVTQIVLGALFTSILFIIKSDFTYYYFAHTFIMVMMAMMIISEFTTILFDTSENAIIQPLPIKGNTISLSRNAHVLIYLSLIAFNLSFLPILLAIFKFGIVSAIIFIFTIFLNTLFTLFLANLLYLIIMRLASGEKLKNLLMYFQIVVAIMFMAGYQFGMKMVDTSVFQDMKVPVRWFTFFVPPAFFSGFIETFTTIIFDSNHIIFVAEAIFIPATAIYFTGKYLTPVFNRKLMDIEQGDRSSKIKTEVSGKGLLLNIFMSLIVSGNEEKASFKLMWKMAGRERLFLQTLLPSYGYIIIMIVLPFFTNPTDFGKLIESDKYLVFLYVFLLVAATLPTALLIGNNKQSSWIFRCVPLNSPAVLFKGFINAAFVRFFIPIYIIVSITICSVWGIKVFPDAIIALMSIYLFTLLFYFLQRPDFPFSQEKAATSGGAGFIRAFVVFTLAIVVGFLHKFLIHWMSYANLLLIPLYAVAIYYVNHILIYRKIDWKVVDRVNVY
jgi:ABC-2 type transport system permease protein